MRLNGKTAIVTGAASGFGAGIARKFAAEGAQVMVVDINHDGAMGMAAELGGGAFGHVCNVADGAQVHPRFGNLPVVEQRKPDFTASLNQALLQFVLFVHGERVEIGRVVHRDAQSITDLHLTNLEKLMPIL